MTAGPPGRGAHVLTAQWQQAYDPKLTPLLTCDDVRRYVGTLAARKRGPAGQYRARQQLFRRATLSIPNPMVLYRYGWGRVRME
jgi:hypothetical protein